MENEIRDRFKDVTRISKVQSGYVVRYHGGVAVVSLCSFDYRDENPALFEGRIGYNNPNATYYLRRGCSNPRNLECFMIKVFRDDDEATKAARRQIEDRIRKDPSFLGKVLSLI